MPFNTLRGVSKALGVNRFCSITNLSSTLQIELVRLSFLFNVLVSLRIFLSWLCLVQY